MKRESWNGHECSLMTDLSRRKGGGVIGLMKVGKGGEGYASGGWQGDPVYVAYY